MTEHTHENAGSAAQRYFFFLGLAFVASDIYEPPRVLIWLSEASITVCFRPSLNLQGFMITLIETLDSGGQVEIIPVPIECMYPSDHKALYRSWGDRSLSRRSLCFRPNAHAWLVVAVLFTFLRQNRRIKGVVWDCLWLVRPSPWPPHYHLTIERKSPRSSQLKHDLRFLSPLVSATPQVHFGRTLFENNVSNSFDTFSFLPNINFLPQCFHQTVRILQALRFPMSLFLSDTWNTRPSLRRVGESKMIPLKSGVQITAPLHHKMDWLFDGNKYVVVSSIYWEIFVTLHFSYIQLFIFLQNCRNTCRWLP